MPTILPPSLLISVCRALAERANAPLAWTDKGPSHSARAQHNSRSLKPTSEAEVLLNLSFDLYDEGNSTSVTDLLEVLSGETMLHVGQLLCAMASGSSAVEEWLSANRSRRLLSQADQLDRAASQLDRSSTADDDRARAHLQRQQAANARAVADELSPPIPEDAGELLSITPAEGGGFACQLQGRPVEDGHSVLEMRSGSGWTRGVLFLMGFDGRYGRFRLPGSSPDAESRSPSEGSPALTSSTVVLSKVRFRWPSLNP